MSLYHFHLIGTVSSDNVGSIFPVLRDFLGEDAMIEAGGDAGEPGSHVGQFRVEADLQGGSSKELNRSLLSALRKVEKRTGLRSAWSCGGKVDQYFDYVLKKVSLE